jgi:hypothetical protein
VKKKKSVRPDRVTASEWIKRLKRIEDIPLRRTVGYIVWWDYVADRQRDSMELFEWLEQYSMDGQPTPGEIIEGLLSLGVDIETATRRSKVGSASQRTGETHE